MKKKIMMLLFILGIFVVGFSSVKADIDITCGDTNCNTFSFKLVQLTPSNTSSSGTYKDYASYVESYYQSEAACGYMTKAAGCGNLTDLRDEFAFSGSYSTGTMGFDFYTNYGFHNLSELIGTSKSYTKAGTYVFLVKATSTHDSSGTQLELDKTEYIIYVSVKSNLTIGTTVAKKIKDINGSIVNVDTKVNELTYGAAGVYPVTFTYNGGSILADFYYKNDITGEYADLTKTILYQFSIGDLDKTVEAVLYDKNGCVKTNNVCTKITFTQSSSMKDVNLKAGEALVFPKGSLKVGYIMWSRTYNGLSDSGYNLTQNHYSNGVLRTYNNGSGGSTDGATLGGSGVNYTVYIWNYPNSNVPDAGVIIKILPYAIIVGLVLISVVLFLLLTNKRKKTETTK